MNFNAFQRNQSLTKNLLKLIVFLILIIAVLSGCGSSGGGENGENSDGSNNIPDINADSISYAGLTTQASINPSNAAYIAIGALQGGGPGINNSGLSTSTANIQTQQTRPALLVLTKTLEESVHKIELTANSGGVSVSNVNSDAWTEQGNCGGLAYYTIEYNDVSGAVNGTETYENYCNNSVTVLGEISFSGNFNGRTGEYLQLSISFNPLYVTYQNSTFISQGTIAYDYKSSPVAVMMNLLLECDCDGKTYKYENYGMMLTERNGYIDFELSGKYYEPEYGYIEFSTVETFRIYDNASWPLWGEFIATGSSGTSGRFQILSSTNYVVEADTDGDGFYDWSKIVNWDEDPSDGQPDQTAPTSPNGLKVNVISDSELSLSWNKPTDNIGVRGYRIYRDGAYIKTVRKTDANDTGLNYYTQYCYTVTALDAMNNESARSSQACERTRPQSLPAENLNGINFTVIDAEYSKQLDKIIMVSSTPSNQLHIYDPETGQNQSVDLNLPPSSVSVGPDGLYAAVGHDGWVSYININSGALIKDIPVSTDVIDIVLAGNGYIYAFPRRDQGETIRCLNIDTEEETLHAGGSIRAGTLAKLHPDGTAVYGADNGLSPSDIEKYNISNGTAEMLYDSPYHGDYPMCGNLWISEDGLRIFTRCGNVFSASENQAEDMIYIGSLNEPNRITDVGHSLTAGKVIAIPMPAYDNDNADTELDIYDYASLAFEQTSEFPNLVVGPDSYPRHGKFVFFNSSGDKYFVVLQVDSSSGMLYDYSVVTYSTQ